MEGGLTDQSEAPPSPAGSATEWAQNPPLGRRIAKVLIHPLSFLIFALAIGSAIGLAGHLTTHVGKTSSNRRADSDSDIGLAGARSPSLPPPGMHLVFGASFTGSNLDTQVWNTCYWYAAPGAGCGHSGADHENEWYLPTQDKVSGGALNLVASPVPTAGSNAQGKAEIFPCRSGMVTTDASFDFTYGYLQVVARIPKGRNTWPALWMLPVDHTTDLPEIDILELIGPATNRPAVAFDPVGGPQRRLVVTSANLSSGWHTFGLSWEPGSLTWFIDGKAVFAATSHVPSQPMYLLANLAITNAFKSLKLPSSCSSSFSIRSVNVWQKAPS